MKITIEEFRKVCKLFLNKLEKTEGSEITIDKNLYWVITDRFNISDQDPELIIGSLSDELEWLRNTLKRKDPLAIDLRWFGHLLIALSQININEQKKKIS